MNEFTSENASRMAHLRWDKTRAERAARCSRVSLYGLTLEQREFVFRMIGELRAAASATKK